MIKFIQVILVYALTIHCTWASAPVLNIYNWSGYLPPSILQQFTQETGIRVNCSTYESNEALYTKLKMNAQRHGYDIIVPSSYTVHRMIKESMLIPLDKSKLSNDHHLAPELLDKAYDPGNLYTLPYLFSTTGMVINKNYYNDFSSDSWKAFWSSRFKNRLLLLDDMREVFSIALLVLGFSPNTQNATEIQQAYLKLRELLPNIRVFSSEGIASLYLDEDLTIGMGWNGDISRVNQINKNVKFIYPKEGYILSIDNLAIPVGAVHLEEAYQFINFLLRPDIAAKISILTGYATPNRSARNYLPKKLLSNSMVYPDKATLQRGIIQLSADEQNKYYEKYWALLKIEG